MDLSVTPVGAPKIGRWVRVFGTSSLTTLTRTHLLRRRRLVNRHCGSPRPFHIRRIRPATGYKSPLLRRCSPHRIDIRRSCRRDTTPARLRSSPCRRRTPRRLRWPNTLGRRRLGCSQLRKRTRRRRSGWNYIAASCRRSRCPSYNRRSPCTARVPTCTRSLRTCPRRLGVGRSRCCRCPGPRTPPGRS